MLWSVRRLPLRTRRGFTCGPPGNLCNEAMKYRSLVTFSFDGGTFNAKSVLSVLGACVKCGGMRSSLSARGADEQEAMEALAGAIRSGLGE